MLAHEILNHSVHVSTTAYIINALCRQHDVRLYVYNLLTMQKNSKYVTEELYDLVMHI